MDHYCWKPYVGWIIPVFMFVLFVGNPVQESWAQGHILSSSEAFFPDQRGNSWRYRGRISTGLVEQIADETFENISTVKGEDTIDGVKVMVFHDSNPGDQGPSDSYYRRDAAGLQYYGSKPGTELEKQLVPYQVIRIPIEVSSSFTQLDRHNLNLGFDIDRDGKHDRVDVLAIVTIVGQRSVTVPLGTYPQALEVKAQMNLTVHLSGKGGIVRGSDTMNAWFVRGIGLVKYDERQLIPTLEHGQKRHIHITEELEEVNLVEDGPSFGRSKTPTKGIFARDAFNHKLSQVFLPARLLAHP
ncbi:MAG: hypothetical protein O7F12_11175 [Nitrospirae bacterium]|nr:hypothetical protein [Nitrospirota bacterium]